MLALEHDHETSATTVRDGYFDGILHMPSESYWPIALAFSVAIVFIMLLTSHFVVAGIFVGIAGLAVAGWHVWEPAEE